ncbi:CCL3 protein, partial [Agelaius phoeniceus]|nr:CCL3 protein [Agelaius phoeniceus]
WRGQRLCRALTRAMCVSPALTDGVPTKCCFTYQKNPIPQRLVRSVFDTSSSCSKPGVIMITLKKRELCADPQEKWVQELQKHFQSLGN